MASFYGKSFMWNGQPSEMYNLYILNLESSGIYDSDNGSEIEVLKQTVLRKAVPYTFGFSQNKVLEFELEFGSPEPLSAIDRDVIGRWLFGQQSYNKLQIFQDDMDQVYFNSIMVQSAKRSVGNMSYVFRAKVICDSPWAWTYPQTYSYNYPSGNITVASLKFFNDSANSDYVYPLITFTINSSGPNFNLTNNSDNGRSFQFTGLDNGETITVNNDRQIVTTSKYSTNRLGNFNYKWFRLVPGVNNLSLNSNIGTFTLTYNLARKIGG